MFQGSLYETLPTLGDSLQLKNKCCVSACGASDCSWKVWMQIVETSLQRGMQHKGDCYWDGADAGCSPAAARRKHSSRMDFSFLLCLPPGMAVGRKDQGLVQGYGFSLQTSSKAHSKDICRHGKARLGRLKQAQPMIPAGNGARGG